MKIKRTCRVCRYVWFSSIAEGCIGQIFRLAMLFLNLMIFKNNSYIDVAKARDELRICPNCHAKDSYKTEFVTEEESPNEAQTTQKNVKNYPSEKVAVQKNSNETAAPSNISTEQTKIETDASPFNWTNVFFISLFLGLLGIDKFYVGKKISGILKLLTLGGFGIWWFLDLFIIAWGESTDASKKKIRNTTGQRVLAFIFIILLIIFLSHQ